MEPYICNPDVGLLLITLLITIMEIRMGYVSVSAMIHRRLKELLDKYGIKPEPVIRRALEEEVKKRVLSELEEEAKVLSERLSHISDEEVASIIRDTWGPGRETVMRCISSTLVPSSTLLRMVA